MHTQGVPYHCKECELALNGEKTTQTSQPATACCDPRQGPTMGAKLTLRNDGNSLHLSSTFLIGFVSYSMLISCASSESTIPSALSLDPSNGMSATGTASTVLDAARLPRFMVPSAGTRPPCLQRKRPCLRTGFQIKTSCCGIWLTILLNASRIYAGSHCDMYHIYCCSSGPSQILLQARGW